MVGLVEHGDRDRVESHVTLTDQVLQASGRSHHDVGATAQVGHLLGLPDAAEDGHRAQSGGRGQRLERGQNLIGQLAGRGQNQCSGPCSAGAGGDALAGRHESGESSHNGQGEGDRLARPGAAAAEHVATGEGVGQGGGLNREGSVDAAGPQGCDEFGGNAERGEGRLRNG